MSDPYTPERNDFECLGCGARATTDERLGACPDCGGNVRNLAVPRE